MKPYTADTNAGRTKARDDIHHGTFDGGKSNRPHAAKSQRKAARQQAKNDAERSLAHTENQHAI